MENEVKKLVETKKIDAAIELAENELKKVSVTDFHKVLGRNFLDSVDDVIEFISDFYEEIKNKAEIKAIFSEMNGFAINYDLWFINLFAFKTCGGLDDTDWLADYDFYMEEGLVLSGLEDIQAVYEDYMKNEKWTDENLGNAMEVCTILIILRLQELFKESMHSAIEKKLEWSKIPIFSVAHDYEIVYSANL